MGQMLTIMQDSFKDKVNSTIRNIDTISPLNSLTSKVGTYVYQSFPQINDCA